MADKETIAFYDARAADYAVYATDHRISRDVAAFKNLFPFGGRVLDLGCGAGQDSADLADAGLTVTSVDASRSLAVQAKARWGVEVICVDMLKMRFKSQFHAVWANASLHHLRPEILPRMFRIIRRSLMPNGIIFAHLKCNRRSGRDGLGRYFCAMDETRLIDIVNRSGGWRDIEIRRATGQGFDGITVDWVTLLACKR